MTFRRARLLVWLLATLLLGLNDHYLKGHPGWPQQVTGKISDFAGLIVAPALLVGLVSMTWPKFFERHRRAVAASAVVLVSLGMALINLVPRASESLISVLGMIGMSWKLWPDPSDVIALTIAPLAYLLLRDAPCRGSETRAWEPLQRALVAMSAVLCLATGAVPVDTGYGFLINGTPSTIHLRPARASGKMNCGLIIDDGVMLSKDFVLGAEATIEPGQALKLSSSQAEWNEDGSRTDVGCNPIRLAAWKDGDAEAVEIVIGFDGTVRRFPDPHIKADLEDRTGLAIIRDIAGSLDIDLGPGLYEIDVGTGEPRTLTSECSFPRTTEISPPSDSIEVEEIQQVSERCTSYVGRHPADIALGEGGGGNPDDEALGGAGSVEGPEYEHHLGFHICTDQTVGIQVGNVVEGHADSQSVTLRWGDGHEIGTLRLEGSHIQTTCPQVRAQCGAIWVRSPVPDSGDWVSEAAWTVVLAREECEADWSTPGSFERRVKVQ